MAKVNSQSEVQTPVGMGSPLQVQKVATDLDVALNTTIAANGSVLSHTIESCGYQNLAIGITSSQAGVLSVQRYIDTQGVIAQGVSFTVSLTANTAAVLNISDGKAFQSFLIMVSNTAGSTATISNFMLLMQAQ